MTIWIVLSIGCIECGDMNSVDDLYEGTFFSKEEALAHVESLKQEPPLHRRDWIEADPSGGFSMTDWQVRVLEVSVPALVSQVPSVARFLST